MDNIELSNGSNDIISQYRNIFEVMTLKNRTGSLFFHLCQQHVDGPRLEHPPRSWRSKKQSAGAGLESCSAQSGMARTCNVIPVNLIAANCNDCSLPFPMVVLISTATRYWRISIVPIMSCGI